MTCIKCVSHTSLLVALTGFTVTPKAAVQVIHTNRVGSAQVFIHTGIIQTADLSVTNVALVTYTECMGTDHMTHGIRVTCLQLIAEVDFYKT